MGVCVEVGIDVRVGSGVAVFVGVVVDVGVGVMVGPNNCPGPHPVSIKPAPKAHAVIVTFSHFIVSPIAIGGHASVNDYFVSYVIGGELGRPTVCVSRKWAGRETGP